MRLAWSADGTELYVQTTERGRLNPVTNHYVFTLADGNRPILFVAGATGFAPVKSILEDAFRRGVQRPMTLYWGVRSADELYLQDQVHALAFTPLG